MPFCTDFPYTIFNLFQTGIAVKKMEEMDAKAEKVHLVSKVHLELSFVWGLD